MLNPEILANLEDMGVAVDALAPLARRADPMDKMAGAHLKIESDVSLLRARDLVIKIGPASKLDDYIKESRLLEYLQGKDFDSPISTEWPRVVGNYALAVSTYIDHNPCDTLSPEQTANQLVKLHQMSAPGWLGVDRKLAISCAEVLTKPDLPSRLQRRLIDKCLSSEALVAEQNLAASKLCHGDLHLGNILPGADGIRLIDFESAASGHPLWDFARLAQASERFGLNASWYQRCWLAWQEQMGFSAKELEPFIEWRCWYGVINLLGRTSLDSSEQAELANRLAWVYDGAKNKWTRI